MGDHDAPKCTFTVRIDVALENDAFNAPSFRFRFLDGTKKQTPTIGNAGWSSHPDVHDTWRFEAVFNDVVMSEALVAAIDDDPIMGFILSDQSSPQATTSTVAPTGKNGDNKARPLTATTSPPQAPVPVTSRMPWSGRGRLISDVFELDASGFFSLNCQQLEETWASASTQSLSIHSDVNSEDEGTSIFQRSKLPTCTKRAGRSVFAPASGIRSVTINVRVDQPVLTPSMRDKLNPLTITIGSARRLPGGGNTKGGAYEMLMKHCCPVFALWSWFPEKRLRHQVNPRLILTQGRVHGETIVWDHSTTILCGRCDVNELLDTLRTSALFVEVHDRDLHPDEALCKLHAKWESLHSSGVDATAVGFHEGQMSAPQSRHSTPRTSQVPKPLDVFAVDDIARRDWRNLISRASEKYSFGVATFRLDELTIRSNTFSSPPPSDSSTQRRTRLKLTSEVIARKRRAQPIGATDLAQSEMGTGPVEELSMTDKLIREPGGYVTSGTTISVYATLERPIPGLPAPCEGQFSRFVLLFPYKETSTLNKLMRVLERVNLRLLPTGVSIRSYQMTALEKEACNRGELDMLTGVMIIDDDFRLVILEGVANGAIKEIYDALPRLRPQSDSFRMFANNDLRFTHRLYTPFEVDLKRIKLRFTLPVLLQMPDIYMRTKVAEPCYDALVKLMEIRRMSRLSELKELDLFPSVNMLLEVESKYGESITIDDIYGKAKLGSLAPTAKKSLDSMNAHEGDPITTHEDDTERRDEMNHPLQGKSTEHGHRKAPTDCTNPQFEAHRRSRQEKDILKERRAIAEQQHLKYLEGKHREDLLKTDPRGANPVYLYSGQKLRTQDALQEELRKKLLGDRNGSYTYGPEFQSLSLSLVNMDELHQSDEQDARKKWTTQRGFVYPAPRPSVDYYRHPNAPSEARCEELRSPFLENPYNPKPLSRDNNRGSNSRPNFSTLPSKDLVFGGTNGDGSVNPDFFRSVHLCGDQARKEMDEALRREQDEWERKLVVDRKQLKFLAHGNICSQQHTKGPQTSQLDKLRDILNGPIQSKPLRIVRNATLPSGKHVPLLPPPASILSLQEYTGPVAATFASTLRQNDNCAMFTATEAGNPKDFHFPSVTQLLTPQVKKNTTHKEIHPLRQTEKTGFLWGNSNE